MKKIAVIGGGAAGMACAVLLARAHHKVVLLERGDRLGRKLSATGNGQGNVTNLNMGKEHYFSDDLTKAGEVLSRFSAEDAIAFLSSMGGIFLPDARGRVYPAGRQASAVTDLFRHELSRLGVEVILGARVEKIDAEDGFLVRWKENSRSADSVVLAAGGRAAENFGTDGTAYALAEAFGHSVTPLSPVLVQLKCDPALVRGLKGIRIDGKLSVFRGKEERFSGRGDVLFTEGGVSGDLVFRASSYAVQGDVLAIDLLPDVPKSSLMQLFSRGRGEEDLLCVVPNGLGRVMLRRAGGDAETLAELLKNFTLPVTGTYGFARAQATRGGIPLAETGEGLESIFRRGLYFAGEILDVDGECGGYNLHWAFASAHAVAEALR